MDLLVFTEPQMGATYDEQLAMARTAEAAGFTGFFRSDHFLTFAGDPGPGPSDAWVVLAGLARETSRIRLGTLVSSVTFRWPGLLAVTVAGVDAMSGGRVELGLGTGWHDGEHAAHGVPFPPLAERFAMLEEALEIVTGMWSTPAGGTFDWAGPRYPVTASPALPKPLQVPGPPVIVGGVGAARTPRLAARYAAEYNVPFAPLPACAEAFGRARAACTAAGRDPASLQLSTAQTIVCGRSDAEVARRREAAGPMAGGAIAGSPAQVLDALAGFAEAGAARLYCQLLDIRDLDHAELIAEAVLPALA